MKAIQTEPIMWKLIPYVSLAQQQSKHWILHLKNGWKIRASERVMEEMRQLAKQA